MATTIAKWPGKNVYEDSTHRLVTDEQITRWNRINELNSDDMWIELTPENIGDYTCTKEDPDGYWGDMGLANDDGTIFDSTSLDPGNYIIKLGLDKLVEMNTVRMPGFRTDTIWVSLEDQVNGTVPGIRIGCTYLNYGIEPMTLAFLCKFFDAEFSIDELMDNLRVDYNIKIKLKTDDEYSVSDFLYDPTRPVPMSIEEETSTKSTTDRKFFMQSQNLHNEIYWPECIKIKIMKKEYGEPNNKQTILLKYVYADMNIVDYYACCNYVFDTDYFNAHDENTWQELRPGTVVPFIPITDDEGNPIFVGTPYFHKQYVKNTTLYKSSQLESKVPRIYESYAIAESASINNAFYNGNTRDPYNIPEEVTDRQIYYNIDGVTVIEGNNISMLDTLSYTNDDTFADDSIYGTTGSTVNLSSNGLSIKKITNRVDLNQEFKQCANTIKIDLDKFYSNSTLAQHQLLSIGVEILKAVDFFDAAYENGTHYNTRINIVTGRDENYPVYDSDGNTLDNSTQIPMFIKSEGPVYNMVPNAYDITIKSKGKTFKYNNSNNCEIYLDHNDYVSDANKAIYSGTYHYRPSSGQELYWVLGAYNLLHVISMPCFNSGNGGYSVSVWRIIQKIYNWKSDTEFEEYVRYGCTESNAAAEDDYVTPLPSEFKWTPWNKIVYGGDWHLTQVGQS